MNVILVTSKKWVEWTPCNDLKWIHQGGLELGKRTAESNLPQLGVGKQVRMVEKGDTANPSLEFVG